MSKKSISSYDSQESGISVEDTANFMDSSTKEIINRISYADRQLHNLNGRLANCIDTAIKNVPTEFGQYTSTIKDFGSKIEQLRKEYENDILLLSDKLKNSNKNYVLSQQKYEQLKKTNTSLQKKLQNSTKNEEEIYQRIEILKTHLDKATSRVTKLENDLKYYKINYEEVLLEREETTNELKQLENNMNDKTSTIVLLENDLSSERSGRELDRNLYLKCENEYLETISSLEEIINEKNKCLKGMDKIVVNKLEELRQEFENDMLQFNTELEHLYSEKCSMIEEELNEKDNEVYELHITINSLQPKYENSKRKIVDLESQIQSLKTQLNECIIDKESNEKTYQNKLYESNSKLTTLTLCFNRLFDNYKNSLDDQIILKNELKILKKLIESEEERLNITSIDKPLKRKSSVSLIGIESMLTIEPTNFSQLLVFDEWGIDSNFISIKNISNETITLAEYYVQIEDYENNEFAQYNFDNDFTLESDHSIRIWGNVCKQDHIMDTDLIADKIRYWFDLDLQTTGQPWKIALKHIDTNENIAHLHIEVCKDQYKKPKYNFAASSSNNSLEKKSCIIC